MQLEVLKRLLNEILFKKLRYDMSGVYDVSVGLNQAGPFLYRLIFTFTTNYSNPNELIEAAWQEIEKLQANGPSEELLKTVINQTLQSIESDKNTHGFWQNYFYWQSFNEKDISELQYWKEELNKITITDIQECAHKFLRHDDLQVFRTEISTR